MDSGRIIGFQLEFDGEKNGIVDIAALVVEAQLVALANLLVALGIQHLNLANPLADLPGAVASVAVDGATHRPRNADQGFQAGQAPAGGMRN